MSKLVLLTLGGSGERIVKSFIMQLASGIVLRDNNGNKMDVQIVFLDTDVKSKALQDAVSYISEYRNLYDLHNNVVHQFHGRNATEMPMFSTNVLSPVRITIDGAALGSLSQIYDVNNFNSDKKEEMDMLYSENAQNVDLREGFIGMPNIGTIALNHLLKNDFNNVINGIANDDKIFFVNSIFGGTGAAGFPLILNKLQQSLNLGDAANQRTLGCLTILPYFSFSQEVAGIVNKGGFSVDSAEFDSKTYAAFLYYNKHLHTNGISAQYSIGTNSRSGYAKCLGGANQDNPAHVLEYLAATSIFHFTENAVPRNNNNTNVRYYEYWFGRGENNVYNLMDIPEYENRKALVRLQLFEYLIQKELKSYVKNNHGTFADQYDYCQSGNNLTSCDTLINKYNVFFGYYDEWKKQMYKAEHTASMKFQFFSGYPGQNQSVTECFEPRINTTHKEGIWNRHEVVTDPDFLGKMSAAVENLASRGWDENRKNDFTLYLVQQSIEQALNDNTSKKSINLN